MIEEVVARLIKKNQTVASMESCSGGALCNAITNVEDSSKVFHFSAVTYSNDYKVRLGVDRAVIEEYSVYSIETARQMAYKISFFAESTYGIGITGKINNKQGEDKKRNKIYISIYDSKHNKYYDIILKSPNKRREKCKEYIVKKIMEKLLVILG